MNFEENTEDYGSCGATLNGQHWIIGGINKKRQVSDQSIKQKKLNDQCVDRSCRWMYCQTSWNFGF